MADSGVLCPIWCSYDIVSCMGAPHAWPGPGWLLAHQPFNRCLFKKCYNIFKNLLFETVILFMWWLAVHFPVILSSTHYRAWKPCLLWSLQHWTGPIPPPPPLNEISGPANGKQVCVYIYIFVGLSLYFSAQSALMDKEILYTDYRHPTIYSMWWTIEYHAAKILKSRGEGEERG